MNRTIKIILNVFFVSSALLYSTDGFSAQAEVSMTFSEAWERVNGENDALKAARARVKQAEYAEKASKALNLPEISLSANYLYLDSPVELSPDDLFKSMEAGSQAGRIAAELAQSYGLTPAQLNTGLTSTIAERENITSSIKASWPIYAGGRINGAQDIATGQMKEARHGLDLESIQQFETLVRYYFGVVLARQVFETRQEVEAGLKTHRDHAVLLEEQGQIARVEKMQSEAAYDKAVVEKKKAHRDLEIAQVALSRMVKSPQLIVPGDKLFIAHNIPTTEEFISNTLARYPGLDILESKKDQAKGLASVEKGKYFPTVALFGNYSLYEEDDLATKLAPDWFVGIGIKIPILERSGRSGKLNAAQNALQRVEHLKYQAQSDLSVLVEKTYRQAQQALEEFEGLLSSRQLAEETVKLRKQAFNQGLSTSLDVVDAELFLAGIKTQRAVAVYNYVLALGKLFVVSNNFEDFFNCQNNDGIEDR